MKPTLLKIAALMVLFTASCKHENVRKQAGQQDTVQILTRAISSKYFSDTFKGLSYKVDTLYILDSRAVLRRMLPPRIGLLSIKYMQDTKQNRMSVSNKYDNLRERIDFPKVSFKGDSAQLIIFQFNGNRDNHFLFKKEHEGWKIIKYYYGVY